MPRGRIFRLLFGAVLAGALALPAAAAAKAESEDAIVVVSGPVSVDRGQTVEGVFVVHGDTTIDGTVTGDVYVLSGRTEVSGEIEGDLAVISGPATVTSGARIGGDVLYGDEEPDVSPRADVGGEVSGEGWDDAAGSLAFIGAFALWLAFGISALILGLVLLLLLPRPADVVFEQARDRLPLTLGVGCAIFFALPIAAFVAALTLVGLPLAIAIGLALLPLAAVGYVTGAWVLGRWLVKEPRSRFLAFLAGWAILRALALIPVIGWIVWLAAVIVGLGALGTALGSVREDRGSRGPEAAPAPAES